MKTIFFIRHAKSSWADFSLKDRDRPLNKRGKRDAPFMAQKLKEFGVQPDAIISSPANRAFTTAKHFAKALSIAPKDILIKEDIYEAWGNNIIQVIRNLPNNLNTILVFGHNPSFTSMANSIKGGEMIDNVPTCGIVHVTADIDSWKAFKTSTGQVEAFHYPKQYFD